MNLKDIPGETKAQQQSRHADILKSLYEILENRTDDISNDKISPAAFHIYLGILQSIHTLNKAYIADKLNQNNIKLR